MDGDTDVFTHLETSFQNLLVKVRKEGAVQENDIAMQAKLLTDRMLDELRRRREHLSHNLHVQ